MDHGPVTDLAGGTAVTDPEAWADRYPIPPGAWLRVNCVSSIDGAAAVDGVSGPLSFPQDQWLLQLLRAQCDALLVGAGTVSAEGYGPLRAAGPGASWRQERGLPAHPTLVVVSGSLSISPAALALRQAPVRPIVLTCRTAPADRRAALAEVAEVRDVGTDRVDLAAGLALLHARGLPRLHCEGGPRLLGSLIGADLVDELCLTVSPMLAGGSADRITVAGAATARRMSLQHVLRAGDGLLLRYLRRP